MKSERKRKFWKIFCLICYLGCIGVLVVESLLPGSISAAQSNSAGSVVNNNISVNEVIEPESLSLTRENGKTLPTEVKVGDSLSCFVSFLPKNTTDQTYSLSVDRPEIASLAEDGTLTFLAKGSVTLTAVSNRNKKLSASATFQVSEISLQKIELTLPDILYPGDTFTVGVTLSPQNATHPEVSYSIDDETVATVNKDGFVSALSPGTTLLTVQSEFDPNITVSAPITIQEIPAEGVRLSLQDVEGNILPGILKQGEFAYLSAQILPENVTDSTLDWTCSPENILALSGSGNSRRAEAVSPGTVTVTVTAKNGKSATLTLSVEEVPPQIALYIDGQKAENTFAFYRGESADLLINVLPALPETAQLAVEFSEPNVAEYDRNTGKLHFTGAGETLLTVGFDWKGERISASVPLQSKDWQVSSLEITDAKSSVPAGTSFQVSANLGLPSDFPATLKRELTAQIRWSCSAEAASVSGGLVSAISPGTVTISAELNEFSDSFELEITPAVSLPVPTAIKLSANGTELPADIVLATGESLPLEVIGTDENGQTLSGLKYLFSSSNTGVLTVSSSGKLTARKAGNATVTVRCENGGAPKTLAVTVSDVPPKSLTFHPGSPYAGDTGTLEWMLSPENTTDKRVSFSSSDPQVLEIDASGNYRAIKPGYATVKITSLADGSVTASGTVHVSHNLKALYATADGKSVTLLTLYVGETQKLAALFETTNGATPYSSAVGFSATGKVVSVDALGNVSALGEGSATIVLSSAENELSTQVKVTVFARTAEHLTLSLTEGPADGNFRIGDNGILETAFLPADTTYQSVTFRSSAPEILYVTADGRLTAKGAGTAVITAVWTGSDTVSAELTFTVKHRTGIQKISYTGIEFDDNNAGTIARNGSARIRITYQPNATLRNAEFSSSDPEIVTVDENGVITAHKVGNAVITVSYGDERVTLNLEVRKQRLSDAFSNWTFRIRKALGHFSAFLVLGIFSALTHFMYAGRKWKSIPVSIGVGFGMSALTEWLQYFVPNRTANFSDVTLDFQGFLCGAAGIFLILSVVSLVKYLRARKK